METIATPVEVMRRFRALQLANSKARKQRLRLSERRLPPAIEASAAGSASLPEGGVSEGSPLPGHRSIAGRPVGGVKQPRELFFFSLRKQRARALATSQKSPAVPAAVADADGGPGPPPAAVSPPLPFAEHHQRQPPASPGSSIVIRALPPEAPPESPPLETPQRATHGQGSKNQQSEAAEMEALLQQLPWAVPQQQAAAAAAAAEGDGTEGASAAASGAVLLGCPAGAAIPGGARTPSAAGGPGAPADFEDTQEMLPLALLMLIEEHHRQATIAACDADRQALERMRPAWLQRQLAALKEKSGAAAAAPNESGQLAAASSWSTAADKGLLHDTAATDVYKETSAAADRRSASVGRLARAGPRQRGQTEQQIETRPQARSSQHRRRQQQQPIRSTPDCWFVCVAAQECQQAPFSPPHVAAAAPVPAAPDRGSVERLLLSLFKRDLPLQQ